MYNNNFNSNNQKQGYLYVFSQIPHCKNQQQQQAKFIKSLKYFLFEMKRMKIKKKKKEWEKYTCVTQYSNI